MTKQSSNKTAKITTDNVNMNLNNEKSTGEEKRNNKRKAKKYLGPEILAARPGGAYRVIEQSVSAALAWTSGQSCQIQIQKDIIAWIYSYKINHECHKK